MNCSPALPWLTARAGNDRSWWAPEVDEQVIVFSPSGDIAQGVVLTAIYQQLHPANGKDPDLCRVDFKDGASIEYNRQSHEMTIHSKGELFIRADGDIWLDAKNLHAFERE
ncbi:MAG: phage baseplate assembly protein V [Sedimenticolaceae bacterium]